METTGYFFKSLNSATAGANNNVMRTKLIQYAIITVMFAAIASRGRANDKTESLVVDGEHFTVRQITDEKLNGLVAYRFSAPKEWRDTSQVYWNYMHITHPVSMAMKVENPTNAEACFCYQPMFCGYIPGPRAALNEGKDGADGLSLRPMEPVKALAYFINKYRGKYSDLKFIGSRDLPDLPKVLHVNMSLTQHGIGEKVTYTLDGKPVEEEFYAVHHYQVVQGEALWGLVCVHSFRAPVGTLNRRRNVFGAIHKSLSITPEFAQRAEAVKQQLLANFNANLQAQYAGIAAAGQRSKQISANNDAFLANIDRSLASSRASSSASGGSTARTANDGQDDYIRGVETMNDPLTGTSQHSFTEQHHWTDGYGNYRNSNDASYNPNQSEVGDWQLMTPAQ